MSTGAGPLFGSNQFELPVGGSNQWMSYPSLPSRGTSFSGNWMAEGGSTNPFSTQDSGSNPLGGGPFLTGPPNKGNQPTQYPVGSSTDLGGSMFTAPTMDPAFTGNFYALLQSLLGGGGDLQKNLLSFLSGGPTSIPGASSLESMANTGNPISALPEWQQMISAQQRNIGENAANLKEQFAFSGDLQSSPFGTSISDYFQQTSKDQDALLGQLQTQALENAMQRELSASGELTGLAGQESQFLDQLFSSAALSSPGIIDKHKGSLLGGIGSLLAGGASGLQDILKIFGIGG